MSNLPHLELIGPAYVASVIAAFHALVRAEPPAGAEPDSEDERWRFAEVAVLPLNELLVARGPFDNVPLADWMFTAGAIWVMSIAIRTRYCRMGLQQTCRGRERRNDIIQHSIA